jgi:membrane associated rhomboid family serine protease
VFYCAAGVVVYNLGASGGVFGLFVVSVLDRLELRPRSLVEVLVLGQFVLNRIVEELQSLSRSAATSGDRVNINRTAHLGGALTGVIVCVAYMRWQALAKLTEGRKRIV